MNSKVNMKPMPLVIVWISISKLVDAGFTFDVHKNETKWDEKLGMIQEFHDEVWTCSCP